MNRNGNTYLQGSEEVLEKLVDAWRSKGMANAMCYYDTNFSMTSSE